MTKNILIIMKRSLIIVTIIVLSTTSYGQRLKTPTLSPFSKVSQQVGLTVINLEYSRPAARGRAVFGNLVPYDKVWRTGANASTKITFTEPAHIGGKPVKAGTYALYTIPGKEKWTIIIHANTKMRSLAGDVYKQENDVFRFEVEPRAIPAKIESFTLQFTEVGTNSLNLQLLWEHTLVNIPIAVEVDEKIAAQMSEFLKTPETIPHRTYFEAAQYYLHNDRDLKQALDWIDAALVKSPENFRYGLLKSKIQVKAGNGGTAIETINLANSWAVKANNANYIEQTDMYRQSLQKKN